MKEVWKAIGITLGVVALIAGIWWVSFGAKIVSSEPIGQGEAIIQKNSAENWVKAQAKFEDLYAGIEAQDQMIEVLAESAERDSSIYNLRNLDGARLTCLDMVGQYNADARKFLSSDFKSIDLPDQIDESQSSTDCKE
jgi:hypothetical protein